VTYTYQFDTQLAKGQTYEELLDERFSELHFITPATPQQQRQGIDRVYRPRSAPHQIMYIEYKADSTAARTGNAFVETVSVDTTGRPGWAVASQADWLFYLVPGVCEVLYIVRMADLRAQLPKWQRTCEQRRIPNEGYHTVGLLVPLDEFEAIAYAVI
jgi:hypothetical protein